MNPYYIPSRQPPIRNILDLAQVAIAAYNAGLLGGEPARMRKLEAQALETGTALAETESEAKYGGGTLIAPEAATGYDYTAAPQGVVNLPGAGAAVLGRKPGLEERRMRLQEGTLGIQRGGLEIDRETLEQRKKEFEIQQKINSPVTTGELSAIEAGLPIWDERLGFGFSKAASGYINTMKNLTSQGFSKKGLYDYSRKNWDYLKKPFIEAAQKEMAAAAKKNDVQKVAQLKKSIDLMDKPDFLDLHFSMCASAREIERSKLEYTKALADRAKQLAETSGEGLGTKDILKFRENREKFVEAKIAKRRENEPEIFMKPGAEKEIRKQLYEEYDREVGAGIIPGVGLAPPPSTQPDLPAALRNLKTSGMSNKDIKDMFRGAGALKSEAKGAKPVKPEKQVAKPAEPAKTSLSAVAAERERIEKLKEGWRKESRAKRAEKERKSELLKREKELSDRITSLQKTMERYGRSTKRERTLARLQKELEEVRGLMNAK